MANQAFGTRVRTTNYAQKILEGWGVSPHLEATLTTSVAPSDNSARVVELPSMVVTAMLLRVTPMTLTLCRSSANRRDVLIR